jgi:hypothetical protein
MVYYALLVGAELDGLTNLQPRHGCDDPNFPYYLKVRASSRLLPCRLRSLHIDRERR